MADGFNEVLRSFDYDDEQLGTYFEHEYFITDNARLASWKLQAVDLQGKLVKLLKRVKAMEKEIDSALDSKMNAEDEMSYEDDPIPPYPYSTQYVLSNHD